MGSPSNSMICCLRRDLLLAAAAASILVAGCDARPADSAAGDSSRIVIKNPIVRLRPGPQRSAGAYMTIMNASSRDDRLLSVTASAADGATNLEPGEHDGGERMEERPNGFRVPARRAVMLEPGGKHVVLTGVADDIKPGASMMLELRFEKSGSLSVEALVRPFAG
ncbi:MAG: copper chaperone PCu(A)C [Candidatus Binatia bacterium]